MAITKERSFYRMCDTDLLLKEAKYKPTAELAVALGERLEEVQFEFDKQLDEATERAADLQIDLNQLDDKVYVLQQEIATLELMIGERDRIIDELKEQNND
jgi:phage shock protein A